MLLLLAVGMSFPVTARAAQDFIVGFDAEFPPYGYMVISKSEMRIAR